MNYLKKKIRAHKKAIEDDEDYGDYIPEVPPHPDDLLKNQQNLASPFTVNNDFFQKTANQSQQHQQEQQQQQQQTEDIEEAKKSQPKVVRKAKEEKEEWQFFAQLSARVQQTVAKTEKELEKIKATTKVDEIEEKTEKAYYFAEELEDLNQKFEEKFSSLETEKRNKKIEIKSPSVALNLNEKFKSSTSNQQIVSPTNQQSTPTSLKSLQASLAQSSNLTKKNVVANTTSQWIGFNRDSIELLDDDNEEELLREQEAQKEKETQLKEQEELERKLREEKIKQRLLEDFGFTDDTQTEQDLKDSANLDKIIDYEKDYLDDPFNTEYAEKKYESTKDLTSKIEKLEKELSNQHLNQFANKPTTLDLSAQSLSKQIDRTISSQNIRDYNRVSSSNKYSSVPCTPGEDKFNVDEIDILATLETGRLSRYNSKESLAAAEVLLSRTNSVQSIHSILSNQSRRSSTNPFDIEIDAADDQQLDDENDDVPNAIAALTEEFTKTIVNLNKEEDEENNNKLIENKSQLKEINNKLLKKEDNKTELIRSYCDEVNKAEEKEEIEQINQEIDNDLSEIDDELSKEVIINSDYIIEEEEEDIHNIHNIEDKVISEEEELQISENNSELNIDNDSDLNKTVLNELQFDELGNIKSDFNQLNESEIEFNEQDIEEVQNYIKEQIPFDPFETIVEDELTNSQSVSSANDLSINNNNLSSLNKQNSIDKDSAFKDVPSNNDDLIKSNSINNKNKTNSDLNNNNNSKQTNQQITTKTSVSSDQSLGVDEQLNDYFDPFKTVNDLSPTSEVPVCLVGEDQSREITQQQNYLTTNNQQQEEEEAEIEDYNTDFNTENLPPPLEEEEEEIFDQQQQQQNYHNQFEMGDNNLEEDQQIDLDNLPPPPLELTQSFQQNEEEIATNTVNSDLQSESLKNEEAKEEKKNELKNTNIDQQEKDKDILREEEIRKESELSDNKSLKLESNKIELDINLDETITETELSNLIVDPFDTSIYNYDTLKSFIPIATKDQIEEFNEKFDTTKQQIGDETNSSTYLDAFKSPLPQRKLLGKKDGFDTFDPFQTTKPPKNTPILKRKQVKKSKSTSDTDEEEEEADESSDFSSSGDECEKIQFVIKARMKEDIEEQENLVIPAIPGPPQTPSKSPKHQLRGVYNKPLLQVGRNRAKIREEYKRVHKKSLDEANKEDEVDLNFHANLRKKYEEENPEAAEDAPLFVEDTTELEDYENPFENLGNLSFLN